MATIHPTAIVEDGAQLGENVTIGPFCYVGPHVTIGDGTVLRQRVTVEGRTTIGRDNVFYAGASIGCDPQDKKYAGEPTRLEIGDRNVVRENCTMSIGTVQDVGLTVVGSDNLFMANAHVAHDCRIGNHIIAANNVAFAGHVTVEDYAIVGGQTGVHQFVRIGAHAMVGGVSAVLRDVPPFVICAQNPAEPHGLNIVGLRRSGYSEKTLRALHKAYRTLYREGLLVKDAIRTIREMSETAEEGQEQLRQFADFIEKSERGIIR